MDLKVLKQNIEDKNITDQPLIFICAENTFIANQYINQISFILNYPIKYLESIEQASQKVSMFSIVEDRVQVYHTKEFQDKGKALIKSKYTYIVCSSIDKDLKDEYKEYIVNVPKLEKWQIQDYVYSICTGIQESKLAELIEICQSDIYRTDNELKKFLPFQESERKYIFEQAMQDGVLNDISKYTIFNLSNALIKRNVGELRAVYNQLDSFDSDGVGILTILINQFTNIIKVQLGNNPTPQSCNLSEKQFYAIRNYSCGYYSKEQLLKIFEFLTSIDIKIREGLITADFLLDYLVTQILLLN